MNKQRRTGAHTAIENTLAALIELLIEKDIRLRALVVYDRLDYEKLERVYKTDLFGQYQPKFHKDYMTVFDGHVLLTHADVIRADKAKANTADDNEVSPAGEI